MTTKSLIEKYIAWASHMPECASRHCPSLDDCDCGLNRLRQHTDHYEDKLDMVELKKALQGMIDTYPYEICKTEESCDCCAALKTAIAAMNMGDARKGEETHPMESSDSWVQSPSRLGDVCNTESPANPSERRALQDEFESADRKMEAAVKRYSLLVRRNFWRLLPENQSAESAAGNDTNSPVSIHSEKDINKPSEIRVSIGFPTEKEKDDLIEKLLRENAELRSTKPVSIGDAVESVESLGLFKNGTNPNNLVRAVAEAWGIPYVD